MKLVTVAGPKDQLESVIDRCIVGEPFQPVSPMTLLEDHQGLYAYEQRNPFSEPLNLAYRLSEDLDIALDEAPYDAEGRSCEAATAWFEELSATYTRLIDAQQAQNATIQECQSAIDQLAEFQDFPEHLNELRQVKYMKFRFGRLPKEVYDGFAKKAQALDEVCVVPMSQKDQYVYFLYVTPRSCEAKMDSMLKSMGFQRFRLPYDFDGTPQEAIDARRATIAEARQTLEQLDKDLADLKVSSRETFLQWYTYTRYFYEVYEVRKLAVQTSDKFFILTGWVPASEEASFEKTLAAFPDVIFSADDPKDVHTTTPPVKLKHNLLGRIFKPFVAMYGLPAYNECDPTVLMAITYSILFGIMYGDLGQGLVLIALGAFLYKKKGLWLGRILCCVGVMASICGVIFGSVFGYEDLIPGFHVLESGTNATRILIFAAAIGVVTIAFMMIINIINGCKQHDKKKIWVTNNSVAGLVFYLGLVVGLVLKLFGINIMTTPYILIVIVLPLLVMFCQEPLGKLLAGDPDWKPESIGSFIMENFFEMFEVLLSYVTNTVSFLRVGAYAISHAGMMMVVYMLGTNDAGQLNYLVIVIGNIIVMGIEGLLVCIQVLRLEFYEMFGRFYSSGGTEFSPMVIDYQKKLHNN
jgi:V/A-type H+-transporting ATPase subunit I